MQALSNHNSLCTTTLTVALTPPPPHHHHHHHAVTPIPAAPVAAPAAGVAPPGVAGVDLAFCTFMLSAVPPRQHVATFRAVAATLRPGGTLCFRDYGKGPCSGLRMSGGKNQRHLCRRATRASLKPRSYMLLFGMAEDSPKPWKSVAVARGIVAGV